MKTKKQIEIIKSASDLSAKLKDDFVLFVGSAISGVSPPHLAMVNIRQDIVRLLSNKLSKDTYCSQLYSKYSELLSADNGSYHDLLDSTKFEEFLWLVSTASSRDALNDLLDKLYTCDKNEYGPNHKALAKLLGSGKCRACFTTNFDNTIELACQDIGINIKLYTEPGKYPAKLPENGENPLLIKLHGSSRENNCVAESTTLLLAQSQNSHGYITDLLADRRVLVLGYSGIGDIDISPHLSDTNATFFWANHRNPEPNEIPDWADYLVLSNLAYPSDSTLHNLLLKISGVSLTPGEVFKEHESADSLLNKWASRTNLDAQKLIRSLFDWRLADPLLHLCHEELVYTGDLVTRCRRYGWVCVQRRAYKTAFYVFSNATGGQKLFIEDDLHLKLGQGFVLWRIGRWEESRSLLQNLTDAATKQLSSQIGSLDQRLIDLFLEIYLIYLEVSRDLLQIIPPKRRLQATEQWNLESIFQLLNNTLFQGTNPQNILLVQLIGYNIRWLLGKQITLEEVKKRRC